MRSIYKFQGLVFQMPCRDVDAMRVAFEVAAQQHEEIAVARSLEHVRNMSCTQALSFHNMVTDVDVMEAWNNNLAHVARYADSDGNVSTRHVNPRIDMGPTSLLCATNIPQAATLRGPLQYMKESCGSLSEQRELRISRAVSLPGGGVLSAKQSSFNVYMPASKHRPNGVKSCHSNVTHSCDLTEICFKDAATGKMRMLLQHGEFLEMNSRRSAVLMRSLECREGSLIAHQIVTSEGASLPHKWVAHVFHDGRHLYLECVASDSGQSGALKAAGVAVDRAEELVYGKRMDASTAPNLQPIETGIFGAHIFLCEKWGAVLVSSSWCEQDASKKTSHGNEVSGVQYARLNGQRLTSASSASWKVVRSTHAKFKQMMFEEMRSIVPPVCLTRNSRTRGAFKTPSSRSLARVRVGVTSVECELPIGVPLTAVDAAVGSESDDANAVRNVVAPAIKTALSRTAHASILFAATPSAAPPSELAMESATLRRLRAPLRQIDRDTISQLHFAEMMPMYTLVDSIPIRAWEFVMARPRPTAASDTHVKMPMRISVTPMGVDALCCMKETGNEEAVKQPECFYTLDAASLPDKQNAISAQLLHLHATKLLRWYTLRACAAHVTRARKGKPNVSFLESSETKQLDTLRKEFADLTITERTDIDTLWNKLCSDGSAVQCTAAPGSQTVRPTHKYGAEVLGQCNFTFSINHVDVNGEMKCKQNVTVFAAGRLYS